MQIQCFVRLFKKCSACPSNGPGDAFYLQPVKNPTENCWSTAKPLGHNTLTKSISRMCDAAGITGFKSNHSLRATLATKLYQSVVDEQLVIEWTGHRSSKGVRNYKRTSNEQQQTTSDILNNLVTKLCNSTINDSVDYFLPARSTSNTSACSTNIQSNT